MTLSQATGCISKAEDRLRNMLAACGPLQSWMGVGSASSAKGKIYLVELPPPFISDEEQDGNFALAEIVGRRPFVLVWTPSDQPFVVDIIASPNCPSQSGVLRCRFEENVPDQLSVNYPEAYRRFLNTVGSIIHSEERHNPGLVELLGMCSPDYIVFNQITVLDHMRTTSDDVPTLGDAHKCELEIRWGATA